MTQINKMRLQEYIRLYQVESKNALESGNDIDTSNPLDIKAICIKSLIDLATTEIKVDDNIFCSNITPISDGLFKQKAHNFEVLKYQTNLKCKAISQLIKILGDKYVSEDDKVEVPASMPIENIEEKDGLTWEDVGDE